MGDWLTPVRFEEIIGETRLAAVSKKQLKRAMEESARVYLDESLLLPDETWEFAARRNYFVDLARRLGWTLTDREADVLARDMTENDARYDLYADTRSGLNRLREKYPLGLLSDAMPSLQRVMDNAGLWELFDQTVLSCQSAPPSPTPPPIGPLRKSWRPTPPSACSATTVSATWRARRRPACARCTWTGKTAAPGPASGCGTCWN